MKLLCIEDNADLVESLRHFLAAGSSITHARSGKEGLSLIDKHRYDVVILDLGLPDISGLEICRELRRNSFDVPILVLSGLKDSKTKVSLFKAGADDYMTKPFTIAELRARLFALLKRASPDRSRDDLCLLKVGSLTLDPLSRQVKRSGKPISLRRKEFDILEYLMRNRDKIVTRPMIMDNVWDSGSSSWDSTINVHIKRVRDKVDRPYKRKFIKTAYGLGYTINDRT
jgi:two-component system, OmpR family, response regulator